MRGLIPDVPFQDVTVGARFVADLQRHVRHPVTPEEARSALGQRLEQRASTFLSLVRSAIRAPQNPYADLFRFAGVDFADVERLVVQEGVEGALAVLYRSGVYLTVDELKGRRPAVRGSASVTVRPELLRNDGARVHVPIATGGSRGAPTPIGYDVNAIRQRSGNNLLALAARGGLGWTHAIWGVPGGATIATIVTYTLHGAAPALWLTPVGAAVAGVHPRYRWSERAVRWGAILGGVRLPYPILVPTERPHALLRWMAELLKSGQTPHLYTSTSSAVRLCQAASAASVELRGAQFTVGGEPVTPDRLAVIERAGGVARPRYTSAEFGLLGYACAAPEQPDDVHVPLDLVAVIQPGADSSGPLPAHDLLFTSLSTSSTLLLINVSLGDEGTIAVRSCDCSLGRQGWTTHLHSIRSHEKLTAGGMTFLDTDVIRVLEETLPCQFGGTATHYQLLEETGADGTPHIRLLVHPDVGPLDSDAVAEAFVTAIGPGSGAERLMSLMWREGGFIDVVRAVPRTTSAGKVLHLHQTR